MGFENFSPGGFLNRLDQEQSAQELQEQRHRELFARKVVEIYQYAEEQLAKIENPIVTDFIVVDQHPSTYREFESSKSPSQIERTLKSNEKISEHRDLSGWFFSNHKYKVETNHSTEKRYKGIWLSIEVIKSTSWRSSGVSIAVEGFVKIVNPQQCYAYAKGGYRKYTSPLRPHTTYNVDRDTSSLADNFRIFKRIREYGDAISGLDNLVPDVRHRRLEKMTLLVRHAVNFNATGQLTPTKEEHESFDY